MDMQGFFTKKGLLLAAKLVAGSTLTITRVCAGAAESALTASVLSQVRQTLSVRAARRTGDTAVLPVTLEAGMAGSAYDLRKLGVYARDPDERKILYKVYRLFEPVAVRPASRLALRFYLEETVSQDLNVTVIRASASLLTEAYLEPVYRKLLAAGAIPVRTVEIAGAELHAYIASLRRLLPETVEVHVSSSVTSGTSLYLNVFCGGGHVATAGPGYVVVITKNSEPVELQNNITGAMVWKGGTVILCPGVPETLGGASNVKSGGMIVGAGGTPL